MGVQRFYDDGSGERREEINDPGEYRGAYAAGTSYAARDLVTVGGALYARIAAGRPTGAFDAAEWTPLSAASSSDLLALAVQLDPVMATVTAQNADGDPTTGTARWPDGATGAFTITYNAAGDVDTYVVTHVLGGVTTTYTQPSYVYDASGNFTSRPPMVLS